MSRRANKTTVLLLAVLLTLLLAGATTAQHHLPKARPVYLPFVTIGQTHDAPRPADYDNPRMTPQP